MDREKGTPADRSSKVTSLCRHDHVVRFCPACGADLFEAEPWRKAAVEHPCNERWGD